MPTLSRAQGDKLVRIAAFFLLTSLLLFALPSMVQADPAAITQAQKDLEQLRALVDKLDNELSIADENYNQAGERLKQTHSSGS